MPDRLGTLLGETRTRMLVLLRRKPRTVTELSVAVGLTDNAIRTHMAALERDGWVMTTHMQRDTGGKPARVYRLTGGGEELFPKAYATVLEALIGELERADGREHLVAVLRAVGRRAAAGLPVPADAEARVQKAADTLRDLGADLEVETTDAGWRLQGYACPLSAVTAQHPEVCGLVQSLVAEITGRVVTECCDRSDRPRCAFLVPGLS